MSAIREKEFMATAEHLAIIDSGIQVWNKWRLEHPEITPDLSGASLCDRQLRRADFRDSILSGADLSRSDLSEAEFCHAKVEAGICRDANLFRADFFNADFTGADLSGANLEYSVMVETNLLGANVDQCRIYGISVWRLQGRPNEPCRLVIQCRNGPTMTVDEIEVAQFIYLLFENRNISRFIEDVSSRLVLILGRFTPERKAILECIADALRAQQYSPVIFDFEKPDSLGLSETTTLLARMSRFIVADLTDPHSIPQELQAIVPDLQIPVQPIIEGSHQPFATFLGLAEYPWVLELKRYQDRQDLSSSICDLIIKPAETERSRILSRRRQLELLYHNQ